MKAYFKGLGMDGVCDIPDKRPDWYISIPKEMSLAHIMSADIKLDNPGVRTAKFVFTGMIPVYELIGIK